MVAGGLLLLLLGGPGVVAAALEEAVESSAPHTCAREGGRAAGEVEWRGTCAQYWPVRRWKIVCICCQRETGLQDHFWSLTHCWAKRRQEREQGSAHSHFEWIEKTIGMMSPMALRVVFEEVPNRLLVRPSSVQYLF